MRGIPSLLAVVMRGLGDLVCPLPSGCVLCGAGEGQTADPRDGAVPGVCNVCARDALTSLDAVCLKCGRPEPLARGLCGECWHLYPPYNRARSAGRYEGRLREAILRLKAGGERYRAAPLGALMAVRVRRELFPPDVLIPVPAHPRKLRERGFDQAFLLAGAVGVILGVPCHPRVLRRRGGRPAQAALAGAARLQNASASFWVGTVEAGLIKGKRVLLVDDVYTTGATAMSCAESLLQAGAADVDVVTAAVVLPEPGSRGVKTKL